MRKYDIELGMESFLLWFGFVFSTVVCAFCFAALISVSFNIVREKEELVNPRLKQTNKLKNIIRHLKYIFSASRLVDN